MSSDVLDILSDSHELYQKKNSDYGDSWKLVGKTLAMWLDHQDEDTLEVPAEPEPLNALGLYFRRLDKVIRSFNGTFIQDEMEVDESVPETTRDQVPYAAMQTEIAEKMASGPCPECGGEIQRELSETYYCENNHVWRK